MSYSIKQFFAAVREIQQKYDADIITMENRDEKLSWCITQLETVDFDMAMRMRKLYGIYTYRCQNCQKDITEWVQNPSKGNLCPYCGEEFPDYEHRIRRVGKQR